MKKRIFLSIALVAFLIGQADAGAATRWRRSIGNTIKRAKTPRSPKKESKAKGKLPENLDEAYGPSILVASFDPINRSR